MTTQIPLYRHVGNGRWGQDEPTGQHALVDDEDAALVSTQTWRLHSAGYAHSYVGGRAVLMHRLILGLQHGDKVHTDHVNRDRLDNRRANLRGGTQQQNNRNVGRRPRKHDLPPGVMPSGKRWRAFMGSQHLGVFDTPDAAAEAAATARTERGW